MGENAVLRADQVIVPAVEGGVTVAIPVWLKEIMSLADLGKAADSAVEKFQLSIEDIWWRGQSSDWKLIPGVHRSSRTAQAESNLVQKFLRKAKARRAKYPENTDHAGWLYLMQHHRLPTRLLDWTQSILVAAYFAVSAKENTEKPGVLWALSPAGLNGQQFGVTNNVSADPESRGLFTQAFAQGADRIDKVAAMLPSEIDLRMMIQLSTFTIHGTATPLEKIPGSDKYLLRFEIPPEAKLRLQRELRMVGIRQSILFPDLDHLAAELKELYC
jgi:hypothetical protein